MKQEDLQKKKNLSGKCRCMQALSGLGVVRSRLMLLAAEKKKQRVK